MGDSLDDFGIDPLKTGGDTLSIKQLEEMQQATQIKSSGVFSDVNFFQNTLMKTWENTQGSAASFITTAGLPSADQILAGTITEGSGDLGDIFGVNKWNQGYNDALDEIIDDINLT